MSKHYTVKTNLLNDVAEGSTITRQEFKELIHGGCPASWFEEQEESSVAGVGDWAFDSIDQIFKVTSRTSNEWRGYTPDGEKYTESIIVELRKATDDEVKQALEEEAERRGFGKGVQFKHHGQTHPSIADNTCTIEREATEYSPKRNVFSMDAWEIFVDGKWAKIIREPIKINGVELTVDDDKIQLSCGDRIPIETFKSFYDVVSYYGLEVFRQDEQINGEINQLMHRING